MTLKLALLAGEPSGDNLGAGVMRGIAAQVDDVEFIGVGGDAMLDAGLKPLASIEALSVNGFKEPILRLPSLVRLLRRLTREIEAAKVDAFLGIDFNVFNFLLERALKRRGIATAHYVSPSVYAWRSGRINKVARSTDLLLCLYPFEPAFYRDTSVDARFIGHPLADEIGPDAGSVVARDAARAALGVADADAVLAVLPGSRGSEVNLMADAFLGAARRFAAAYDGDVAVVVPCPRPKLRDLMAAKLAASKDLPRVVLHDGNAREPLLAADIALVKSGTSTLEAMLLHRPMVVSYKLGAATYALVKRLVNTPYVALPNILAGEALVPELLQADATAENLGDALLREADRRGDGGVERRFAALHAQLRRGADGQAANAVLELMRRGGASR